jgi:hypothetical protein
MPPEVRMLTAGNAATASRPDPEGRPEMRKIMIIVIACAMLVATGGTAFAGDKRVDTYYVVMCYDPTGALVQAESVDAHAIEQGGKAHAIDLFNAHHLDWHCWPKLAGT